MAIDNNYEGPPSLEIYQEFIQSSSIGEVDQNVVIVAPHYNVFKATGESLDSDNFKEYKGSELAIGWRKDTVALNVDKNSTNVVFKDASVAQGSLDGTIKTNTSIKFEKDLVDTDSTEFSMPVSPGDKVLITHTDTKTNTTTEVISEIRRVSIDEDDAGTTPVITTYPGGVETDVFTIEGTYTGIDRIYYITVIGVSTDGNKVTIKVETSDGGDTDNDIFELTVGAAESTKFTSTGLSIKAIDAPVLNSSYSVNAVSGSTAYRKVIHIADEVSMTGAVTVHFGKFSEFVLDPSQYTVSDAGVSIAKGAVVHKTVNAASTAYRIICGKAILEYREQSNEFSRAMGYITNANIYKVGYTGVENPLGAMVSVAMKGGRGVYCVSVSGDSVEAYTKAFSILSKSTTGYAIVLGSLRKDVIAAADAFVTSMADPSIANYKILYYGLDASNLSTIMGTDEATKQPWRATVKDGLVTLSDSTNTGNFNTYDVLPGDIFRTNYNIDKRGVTTYTDYVIDYVTTKNTLQLKDTSVTISLGLDFTIHRELEGSELVEDLKKRVYTKNHRSYCVFGDGINVDGIENAPAWLLAALPAGMRAGEYCQRPISNIAYTGCSANNTMMLGSVHLKELASRGVWILANTSDGNTVYNYHQLSTDMSDKKKQEQSYTTNFDNISREARALLSPYYGNSNISSEFIQQLYSDVATLLSSKTVNAPSPEIGPQLIRFENLTLIQNTVNRDRVDMEVDYYMPAPFNHVKLRQRLM